MVLRIRSMQCHSDAIKRVPRVRGRLVAEVELQVPPNLQRSPTYQVLHTRVIQELLCLLHGVC